MENLSLIEFASEFVIKARNDIKDSPGIRPSVFSSRQSQAISSLGISRIIRTKEQLNIKDLVDLAVITSPPEAQGFAELIAFRILLGEDDNDDQNLARDLPSDDKDLDAIPPQLTGHSLLLNEILDLLNFHHSVNQKDYQSVNFVNQFENQIFSSDNDKELSMDQKFELMKKRLAYQIMGGRKGIVANKISGWDELIEQVKKKIIGSIPSMSDQMLIKSNLMDLNSQITELSREDFIVNMSKLLETTKSPITEELIEQRNEIVNKLNQRQLSSALDILESLDRTIRRNDLEVENIAPSLDDTIKNIESRIKDAAHTFDDILRHPNLFSNQMNYEKTQDFIENSIQYNDPLELLDQATTIDDFLSTNFGERILNRLQEDLQKLDPKQLLRKPMHSAEWYNLLEDQIDELPEESRWEDNKNLIETIQHARDELPSSFITERLDEKSVQFFQSLIEQSLTKEQLEETVDFGREKEFSRSVDQIKRKGSELGMSSEEIARLIGDIYEILEMMIENDNPSYERVNNILNKGELSKTQIQNLMKHSFQNNSSAAMGALSRGNLELASNTIPDNDEGKQFLRQSFGAGGGENLLKDWFDEGHKLEPWVRQIVKDVARQVMIDLAKTKASALIGSSEAGPLPEGTTRPYSLGDDPDTIDLEESLENILSLGKSIENIDVNDLIVRKTVSGRRCVIFLVDISGSMSGQPLASASIATVMLLFAFARDELGIALFESNTHVICEINEQVDVDELSDKILALNARGGTQMQAALDWAEKQFNQSKSKDKMFIMVTDAMVGDFARSQEHLRNIADQEVTSVLILPASAYGIGNIQGITDTANAQVVTVEDWREFPEMVSKVLSRS